MYTGHFGLDDGPFHGKAEGQDVYVGPQQAVVVSRLRKALGIADTAVAVSGPVGVGKTTLVRRAIADIAGRKIVIPVDRIRLEPDEVLDLLLSRFDVSRQPKGTIQRVAAFRRLLQERLSNDTRVFIVVEDAERVGNDALLEIEALTATDGGEPVGANIVLMGGSELPDLLVKPALARLRQRIRLRQVVAPFDAAEVEGYMRHCLEAAGGVLEQIFEPGTARIVHRYSGGIARVVDNLCESALVAASEAGLATILPEFLQEVADNCGLEPQWPEPEATGDEVAESVPAAELAATELPVESVPVDDEPAQPDELSELPAPLIAPPKLALVEKPPVPEDEAKAEDAPEPVDEAKEKDAPEMRHEPVPLADDPSPTVDVVSDVQNEVPAGEPSPAADDWRALNAHAPVSRIDEVLPELLERLQSSARGRVRPASPPARPQGDDEHDIPTLSNSMRVAVLPVLPVRRMDERPLTAVDADEITGIDDPDEPEEVEAPTTDEALTGDAEDAGHEATDCGAAGSGTPEPEMTGSAAPGLDAFPADDDDTGIAEALTEADPQPDDEPVGLEEVEAPEAVEPPAQETTPVESVAEPDPEIEVPQEESAAPDESEAAATAEENAAAAEFGGFEFALAPDDEPFSFGAVVDEADGDEANNASPALSVEGELSLAADAETDVFDARKNAVDGAAEPELDALQAAIEAANAWQVSESDEEKAAAAPGPAPGPRADLPEITLDAALEEQKPSRTDLDRWAEEISKAKSLEDISDILAETIFGNEEIEAISAEIRAKKAAEKAAGEKTAPAAPKPVAPKASTPKPVPPSAPKPATAKASPAHPAPAPRKAAQAMPARPAAGGVNMTMSQRIEMVNTLKGRKPPVRPMAGMSVAEIVLAEQPDEPLPKAGGNAPAPIESQIDTAITQSRKVLSEADLARMAAAADSDGDDDGDKKGSRGLFGFFRRSSKS